MAHHVLISENIFFNTLSEFKKDNINKDKSNTIVRRREIWRLRNSSSGLSPLSYVSFNSLIYAVYIEGANIGSLILKSMNNINTLSIPVSNDICSKKDKKIDMPIAIGNINFSYVLKNVFLQLLSFVNIVDFLIICIYLSIYFVK